MASYSISILALNNLFDMKKLLALKSNFQGHGVLGFFHFEGSFIFCFIIINLGNTDFETETVFI